MTQKSEEEVLGPSLEEPGAQTIDVKQWTKIISSLIVLLYLMNGYAPPLGL